MITNWWLYSLIEDDEDEDHDEGTYLLNDLVAEDDIEPIVFNCKTCNHSSDNHNDEKCNYGIFRKCDCKHFVMNDVQVKKGKSELLTIESILFKNYIEAKRLNDI